MRQHVALGWIVLVEHISFSPLGGGNFGGKRCRGGYSSRFHAHPSPIDGLVFCLYIAQEWGVKFGRFHY